MLLDSLQSFFIFRSQGHEPKQTGWLGVVDLDLVSLSILTLSNALNGSTGMCCQQWHYCGPYVQDHTMCCLMNASEKNWKEIKHVRSSVPMYVDSFSPINFSLRPERFWWSLYVSLETVHVNGTMVLVSVFQVPRWYGRFFPIWRRRTDPLLQLHEAGHIWRDVLGFALWWRGLETTIVLLTVWQTLVSHRLCFTDERDLWRNGEMLSNEAFLLLFCSTEISVTLYNKVLFVNSVGSKAL